MDPLDLAWLEFRENPDTGPSAFIAVATTRAADSLHDHRDPHHPLIAATDAVLDLIEHPERYDPARLSLVKYLRMAARRNLLNLWEKEDRHLKRRESGDPVEVAAAARNDGQEAPEVLEDHPALTAAIAGLSADDRAVLALMREGERATAAYAPLLHLGDRPPAELAAEVKKAKDRIIARLKRAVRTT